MSTSSNNSAVCNTGEAVVGFIESLLREVPDEPPQADTKNSPVPVVSVTEVSDTSVTLNQCETTTQPMVASGVPDWAEAQFQCLLFHVSGLLLAVPLVKLSSVINWEDTELTRTPSAVAWYLGLANHHGESVKIIDTALMVMPENRRQRLEVDPTKRLGNILLVDNNRWGLACDSIGEVIQLTASEVKWRTGSGKRLWLAGTVIERLCAIVDTDVFANMLDSKCT